MCAKLGFDGYSELKYVIKEKLKMKNPQKERAFEPSVYVDQFLKKINEENYDFILEQAVSLIADAQQILFTGTGTSGVLGKYGARYFLNVGLNAHSMIDSFAPVPKNGLDSTLVIVLSVSGETTEVIKQVQWFKEKGVKILSLTNNEHSTLAHLANYNISYYMQDLRSEAISTVNLTTQVPVVLILELLAHRASKKVFSSEENK